MHRLVGSHAPEFTEVGITMAQAKVLYVVIGRRPAAHVRARRPPRDRLVVRQRAGRPARRAGPARAPRRRRRPPPGRRHRHARGRQALLERFRELNVRQLRDLLSRLDAAELAIVERSMGILDAAIDRAAAASTSAAVRRIHTTIQPQTPGRRHARESPEPPRPQQAERHAPVRRAPCSSPGSRPGAASSRSSCRTSTSRSSRSSRPYPGAGSSDVDRAGDEADRERHQRRAAARDHPVDLVELDLAGRRPSSRSGPTSRRRHRPSRRRSPRPTCPASAEPTVQALNINASPVVISSIAATGSDGLAGGRARSPGPRSSRRSAAIEGVARADVTGGLEERVFITLDPAKLAAATITSQQIVGVLQANNLTLPSGPAARRRVEDPGLDDRHADVGRPDPRPRRRLPARGARAAPGGVRARPHRAPAGSAAPSPRPSVAPLRRTGRAEADHDRRPRHGRARPRRDDRLRPDQRQPGADPDRVEGLEREHGRGGRRRPGQAGRDRRAATRTS